MRSSFRRYVHRLSTAALLACVTGCASQYHTDPFREDGPSSEVVWNSPTATDLYQRIDPQPQRARDFPARTVTTADGTVPHWPLYFQDPFVDKGHGRTDEDPTGMTAGGRNKYHLGWEDYVALPYSPARWLLNTVAIPVSMVVQHPFTEMESDGHISRQILGYDHDPTYASDETKNQPLNDIGPRLIDDGDAGSDRNPHGTLSNGAHTDEGLKSNGGHATPAPANTAPANTAPASHMSPMTPVRTR
jgi:hypothetical protein